MTSTYFAQRPVHLDPPTHLEMSIWRWRMARRCLLRLGKGAHAVTFGWPHRVRGQREVGAWCLYWGLTVCHCTWMDGNSSRVFIDILFIDILWTSVFLWPEVQSTTCILFINNGGVSKHTMVIIFGLLDNYFMFHCFSGSSFRSKSTAAGK